MFDTARAPLVVIAISGRALAQSAVRGGWRVHVLDAFADRDTRAMGEAVCVARDHAIALHPARMFAALGKPSERIIVTGRVLDEGGRPVRNTLVEIWQANAAGRYVHKADQHDAPLDPNFEGVGRCLTDAEGRFRFITIKPGAYPWGNHENAWRPQHIHFSVFGRAFAQRLVTQMYFPGDPLFEFDPIFNSVRNEKARQLMVCAFDLGSTRPDWARSTR